MFALVLDNGIGSLDLGSNYQVYAYVARWERSTVSAYCLNLGVLDEIDQTVPDGECMIVVKLHKPINGYNYLSAWPVKSVTEIAAEAPYETRT